MSAGGITSAEIRDLIVQANGAATSRGIDPGTAGINIGINYKKDGSFRPASSKVRSASCEKGSDWDTYWVNTDFTRGTLCNGKVIIDRTEKRGRRFFQNKLTSITSRILLKTGLKYSGPDLATSINANDKKASVYFQKYNKAGKMTDTYLALRIEGSDITVENLG